MVQQKIEKQDFPILDETSAEQVAIEEKVMAGEPIVQPDASEPAETQAVPETTPAATTPAATPAVGRVTAQGAGAETSPTGVDGRAGLMGHRRKHRTDG